MSLKLECLKKEISQGNWREITITVFPLTLENTALADNWDDKLIAPTVDRGSWFAPEIALSF